MRAGLEKHGRSVAQGERGVSAGVAVWINGGGEEGSTDGRFTIFQKSHRRIILQMKVRLETTKILPVLSQRQGKLLLGVGLVSPVAVSLARFGGSVPVRFARVAGHEAGGVVENAVLAAHHAPSVPQLALQVVVERFEPSKWVRVLHVLRTEKNYIWFAQQNVSNKCLRST